MVAELSDSEVSTDVCISHSVLFGFIDYFSEASHLTVYDHMDLKDTEPVLAMKHHLQKYLKKLFSDIKEMEARETDSKKEVASLANLLEQMESVAKVDIMSTTLASLFPDAQSSLLVKISSEVDAKLDKLKDLIEPLRRHNSIAYRARLDALNLIRKHPDDLNIFSLTSGQPTVPPIMVMLDWVDTIERQTREIYHIRLYYLENVLEHEIVNSQTLVRLWSEDMPAFLNTVKDVVDRLTECARVSEAQSETLTIVKSRANIFWRSLTEKLWLPGQDHAEIVCY